jgi:hypothetical protein
MKEDAMEKTQYRILKLRSGEEIIAKINGQTKNKMIIERPMMFLHRYIIDSYGKERELTSLKSWMSHTNEIETKIPKDYIATFLVPDNDVVNLYDKEKEREDVDNKPPKQIIDFTKPTSSEEASSEEDMNNLFNLVQEAVLREYPELEDDLEDIENGMVPTENPEKESSKDEEQNIKNFITMTMFMPPEALMSLVDTGLLNMDDIQRLINALSNDDKNMIEYTGDNEERQTEKDFGNDWKDWSPDLKDYFK